MERLNSFDPPGGAGGPFDPPGGAGGPFDPPVGAGGHGSSWGSWWARADSSYGPEANLTNITFHLDIFR